LTWTKPLFGSESSGASCPRLTTRNAGDANTSSFKVHHEGRRLPFVVLERQGECGRGGDNAVGTEITLISMRVRIRAPSGQHTVELDAEATVGDLKALIAEQAGVAVAAQELLAGFPPKKVTAGDGDTCASSGIAQGEIITVNELELAAPEPTPTPPNPDQIVIPDDDDIVASTPPEAAGPRGGATADIPLEGDEDHALMMAIAASMEEANARTTKVPRIDGDWTDMATDGDDAVMHSPHNGVNAPTTYEDDGTVAVRRVIDSDNSCLFNAVGYVTSRSLREAPRLRRVIADAVAGDTFTYTEGFLGKPNAEYCTWIMDSQHWGGAVELSILASYHKKEIAAYDIQTQRCDVYGTGEGYSERVMLLYDGLHYDAMALTYEGAPPDMDITIVPSAGPEADAADAKARKVVAEAHQARQFTDTANFSLRCLVCQQGLVGEKEALEHAKSTGHQNFGEY
jgi:ubiquitin thioesterase OTU1